jgi:hypothetical protein
MSISEHNVTIRKIGDSGGYGTSTLTISITDPHLDLLLDNDTPVLPDEWNLSNRTSVYVSYSDTSFGAAYAGFSSFSASFTPEISPVPLPSGLLLFGSGLSGLFGLRKMKLG